MGTFFSEQGWLCLTVTAVLGATILCRFKKSQGQVGRKVVCLAGLWGGACLLSLSLFWGSILFSLSCFLLYTYFSGQELLPVDQKAVLITGSDSGIGHALSKYLDELGFTVFAGVLDGNGSGAEELRRTCSKRLSVLQLDVTNPQQIKDAHSKVKEEVQNRGLWALVSNAGVLGLPTDGELIPMTDYKRCMAVNFFGAVEVTKAFLPLLRKSKGRLVSISSMGDIAGTSDMWDKLEKNILDHLTPDVQKDYGQDYIHKERSFLKLIKTSGEADISPVLLDIQHAISAKSPFALYAPGKMSYLWLCFASCSPTGIFDYVSKKCHSYGRHMPRALSTPNLKNETM
ncbi:17-beta-hydroxysteroid dehydrogenase type 2 isoform X2 [Hippopotamus amphibius kiboko]|uniref:17-beta-hydroxysteroid dehydrogenase type 2 isoform X2 n=1 Tax=Hippopotamus amphibius kiboko TaxID=575201 RepID=UPI00259A1DE4|nr:17-beta-hydroxysteroid dehydrogenase type 2 isoform X2 [Hippopotamus amphibius kiboko]